MTDLTGQVVIEDEKGHVMTRYRDQIQGVRINKPSDVITDTQGRILIADYSHNQLSIMNREGDEMRQLIQDREMIHPECLSLDTVHHRLYVSGRDHEGTRHVFVYDCSIPTCDNTFKELITTIDLTVQL